MEVVYIDEAQRVFSECAQGYLLKPDGTSSPHITLAQFVCTEERAQAIWDKMRARLEEANFQPFTPTFSGISFRSGVGPYQGTIWVQNEVDRGDQDSPITRVHMHAVEVLSSCAIPLANAHGDAFRPHLTLARIVESSETKTCSDAVFSDPGPFRVAFGRSDAGWQFAETLATFPDG